MSFSIVHTRASLGIEAPLITVETHLSNGLPSIHIVGLAKTIVKESIDRVRSALLNIGFKFPNRRMTINLAPADLPKQSSRFDLPISIGILLASEQLPPAATKEMEFLGELELSGKLRAVDGVLCAAIACAKAKHDLVVPTENAAEAALYAQTRIFYGSTLKQICAGIIGDELLPQQKNSTTAKHKNGHAIYDLNEVRGQKTAVRALTIAAAGGHHLLMVGPPGVGKTMLAQRISGILPKLKQEQALEVAAIRSLSHKDIDIETLHEPPFCAPHHTATPYAIAGGGAIPRPGSVSLAHNGILFLDELPEFKRQALEVLRQPIESGYIVISRAQAEISYPAQFQLIAAMNPCPCGYAYSRERQCRCSPRQIDMYRSRISGPLLDRIDLHIDLSYPANTANEDKAESSSTVLQHVTQARHRQEKRNILNGRMNARQIKNHCVLCAQATDLMNQASSKIRLSTRAYQRVIRVARTIADLEQEHDIKPQHLREALAYRSAIFDR